MVTCHPEIADLLVTVEQQYIEEIEKRLQKRVLVKARSSYHVEQYEILGKKASEKTDAKEKKKRAPEQPDAEQGKEAADSAEPDDAEGKEARPAR